MLFRSQNFENTISIHEGKQSDIDILNEKTILELTKKYHTEKQTTEEIKEKVAKKSIVINEENVKAIKQTLNLIRRYDSNQISVKRQGFASTLLIKAEEIGAINTVRFLINVIDQKLVFFLNSHSHATYL